MELIILFSGIAILVLLTFFGFVSRFQKCPSDNILVVFGLVGKKRSAQCYHGGGTFVWPVFQDYRYLDLTPMTIDIGLKGALSKQNIRVNTPSTFTVGISVQEGVMENAAQRLLGMNHDGVKALARDIIFGQMRVVIATMTIEEINTDRDKLIKLISEGVESELQKVGLRLINVNVQDITDESGYIEALGREAAARAINEAKIKVAVQERDGEIGRAEAEREQRIRVAQAHATAVEGENLASVQVANSNAEYRTKQAEAERLASASEKVQSAMALQEAYIAEQKAELQRAELEKATREANVVIPAEIEKRRAEISASAEAEAYRRVQQGNADGLREVKKAEADGVRFLLQAEADGLKSRLVAEAEGTEEVLSKKAAGFQAIIKASGSGQIAANLLITEQLPALVEQQVKAISNLKIDRIMVWDGGKGEGGTANFLSSLGGVLPPLHDLAKNAGVELPDFMGRPVDANEAPEKESSAAPKNAGQPETE